ncbi:MAG: rhomboid family intramembrane serine protease [Bacteroidia bacterium]|nr:rhomboid family intramembrane serine protease [Bacteroidia bacterium]
MALFRPYLIKNNNEWWRWISGGFIHQDYMHLFVNMLSFYFFANYSLEYFNIISNNDSGILFLLFYIGAIIMSGMYSYYKYQNYYGYAALGASGAVAAVIFSFVLINPFGKIYLYGFLQMPAWLFGIVYLYYEYAMGKRKVDNIGHDAHFFGALYGFVVPILLHPQTGLDFIKRFTELFN